MPGLSRTAHRFYIERLANHVSEIIMPTLILKIASSQITANHASLAEALTDVTVNELGKRREVTAVLMEEIPAAHWFIGAQAAAQPTRITETDKRGKHKDKGWAGQLIPKELIVARYFAAEQQTLHTTQTALEAASAALAELEEEHSAGRRRTGRL